jgi:hypothetical protein
VLDGAIAGAGAVLLVAGFLPWWRAEVTAGGVTLGRQGSTAWDVSPAWWLPVLAGTVTGGLWLARRLGRLALPWLPAITALVGLIGLGLVIGRWLTLPATASDFGWYAYAPLTDAPAVAGHPGPGLYLALAALVGQLAAAALRLRRIPPAG